MSSRTPAQDTPGGSHTHPHLRSQEEGGLERTAPTPSPTHVPPPLPGLTLALRASGVGLEARGADTLEAALCVLTPAVGTGRGAAGTLIHVWGRRDQSG